MDVFFYASDAKGTGKFLWELYHELALEYNGEFFQTIDSLSQKLRKPNGDLLVGILLASTREELLGILSIRNLLENIRIILILPDSNEDTVRKGHSLYPRFLTDVNGSDEWIAAVLRKMIQKSKNKKEE